MSENSTTGRITGKLLLQGRLSITSPLIIGSGEKDEGVDMLVLKDKAGNPYIPATALAGVLRHYFWQNAELTGLKEEKEKEERKQLKYFWGADYDGRSGAREEGQKEEIYQSAFCISDLVLNSSENKKQVEIKVRDGVKITAHGVAAEVAKAKYDYEVLEPGVSFDLKLEVTLRQGYEKDIFCRVLTFLTQALHAGKISLGAMTSKGFGRCRLEEIKYHDLCFSKQEHVLAWLADNWLETEVGRKGENDWQEMITFPTKQDDLVLKFSANIKTSLIVRSYSGVSSAPDAVHITAAGKPVLPGTSLKGALRSRAVRIINTLGEKDAAAMKSVKELFGWVETEKGKGEGEDKSESVEKYKSRVIVEESVFKTRDIVQEVHRRIKTDRFTGGTIKSALFDTAPLWPVGAPETAMLEIKIIVKNYKQWEAGLLLLLLKDLWTGDLPLGGEKSIGRGVLQGLKAEICFEGKKIVMEQEKDGSMKIEKQEALLLNNLVEKFTAYLQNGDQEGSKETKKEGDSVA